MLKALLKTAPAVGFATPNFAVVLTPYPLFCTPPCGGTYSAKPVASVCYITTQIQCKQVNPAVLQGIFHISVFCRLPLAVRGGTNNHKPYIYAS